MFRIKRREINWTIKQLREFESKVAEEFTAAKIRGPVHLSYGNENYLIDLFQYIHPEDWVFSTWRNHYHALLHGVPKEELMDKIMQGRSISFQSPEHHFYTSAIVGGILPIAVGTALGIKWKNDTNFESYESTGNLDSLELFLDFPGYFGLKCKICNYKGTTPDLVKSHHEHYDKRMVWCFIGDMAAESGTFCECLKYSIRNSLPIHFVIENNVFSTNTPTQISWGIDSNIGICDIFQRDVISNEYKKLINKYVSYFEYKRDVYPHVGVGQWINF